MKENNGTDSNTKRWDYWRFAILLEKPNSMDWNTVKHVCIYNFCILFVIAALLAIVVTLILGVLFTNSFLLLLSSLLGWAFGIAIFCGVSSFSVVHRKNIFDFDAPLVDTDGVVLTLGRKASL